MAKLTQNANNPFKFSDSNKRYHTFDYYMKSRFGGKCARIALDAGFSCPNKEGGRGGCIFCYGGSSGATCGGDIEKQYYEGIAVMQRKWDVSRFIPYLQANTNTYAPIDVLEQTYARAASFPGAVMLIIATRADCLSSPVIDLLCRTAEKIPLTVELGLQSIYDETAELINRGHSYEDFLQGYETIRKASDRIQIGVHLINGLPGEDKEMMLNSAAETAKLRPDFVKLHLLHVLKDTPLCELYSSGKYTPMDRQLYIETICRQIELFHPETVIARVTGDAPSDSLVAPLWCSKKTSVTNDIDKYLFEHNMYQGKALII